MFYNGYSEADGELMMLLLSLLSGSLTIKSQILEIDRDTLTEYVANPNRLLPRQYSSVVDLGAPGVRQLAELLFDNSLTPCSIKASSFTTAVDRPFWDRVPGLPPSTGGKPLTTPCPVKLSDIAFKLLGEITNSYYSCARLGPGEWDLTLVSLHPAAAKRIQQQWAQCSMEDLFRKLSSDLLYPDVKGRDVGAARNLARYYASRLRGVVSERLKQDIRLGTPSLNWPTGLYPDGEGSLSPMSYLSFVSAQQVGQFERLCYELVRAAESNPLKYDEDLVGSAAIRCLKVSNYRTSAMNVARRLMLRNRHWSNCFREKVKD